MSATLTAARLACSQCGAEAPEDPFELVLWKYGRLALEGDFADAIDWLLLCPDCVEEEHDHAYDEGASGD
jgi:hypothetical protein